ncbi:hypothetical protein B566_EDAN017083 [Ephemera danica]|nr:hypothetical protein B566_EDAN017083 [Ephemera danica]
MEASATTTKKSKGYDEQLPISAANTGNTFKEIADSEVEFYASEEFSQYLKASSPSACLDELEKSNYSSVSSMSSNNTSMSTSFKQLNNSGDTRNLSKSSSLRKFPGPAGLLPQLNHSILGSETREPDKSIACEIQNIPSVSSQSQPNPVSGNTWQEATRVLQVRPGDESCPLGRYTLAWVRQMAVARRLPQHRVPFLLVGLKFLDTGTKDPSVTLQDPSGDMRGILHHELWAEYSIQLLPGSVLALRQVGVMSTGPFARHQCLNITANNVITIFTPANSQGSTQMINVTSVPRDQLLREVTAPISVPALSSELPRKSMFPVVRSEKSLNLPRTPLTSRSPSVMSQSSVSSFNNPPICSIPKSSKQDQNTRLMAAVKTHSSSVTHASSAASKVKDQLLIPASTSARPDLTPKFIPKSNNSTIFTLKAPPSSSVNASKATIPTTQSQVQSRTFTPKRPMGSQVIMTENSKQVPSKSSSVQSLGCSGGSNGKLNMVPFIHKSLPTQQASCAAGVGQHRVGCFTPKTSQSACEIPIASTTLVNTFANKESRGNTQLPLLNPASSMTRHSSNTTATVDTEVNSLLEGLDADALFGDF